MPPVSEAASERIAKRMARAGLCSRREAERWIEAGRVAVNGTTLTTPAVTVTPDDTVMVDGKTLSPPEATRLWRYHKPRGLVTSHRDEQGRRTVFDALPRDLGRVISVGRLDVNSEGLLLLTNDGGLARHLELPATGLARRYRVRAHGTAAAVALKNLAKGVHIDGIDYGPVDISLDTNEKSDRGRANQWYMVSLREGKNREIRRLFEHVGLAVNRLIRISYGSFQLGGLKPRLVEEVPRKVLREQLGEKWVPKGRLGKRNDRKRT